MNKYHVVSVGLVVDAKSPFWVAQWSLSNGVRLKRSTKVPVAGGMFRGERLSKVQAKNRALVVAQAFAQESLAEAVRTDNLSVRMLFDKMLAGKLGRLSVSTYNNARTTYALFCDWLGKRALEPARLVRRGPILSSGLRIGALWCGARRCSMGSMCCARRLIGRWMRS